MECIPEDTQRCVHNMAKTNQTKEHIHFKIFFFCRVISQCYAALTTVFYICEMNTNAIESPGICNAITMLDILKTYQQTQCSSTTLSHCRTLGNGH